MEGEDQSPSVGGGSGEKRKKYRYRIKVKEKRKIRLKHRKPWHQRFYDKLGKQWKTVLTTLILFVLIATTIFLVVQIFSDATNRAEILRKWKIGI